jgi:Kef-type K+ transport system membrane component KefB
MAVTVEHSGMTAILGAVLAGFAIPASEPWADAVGEVLTGGERLIPIYFVVSGITVLTKGFATASASLICLAILAGLAGKIAGGYTGARLGGLDTVDSLRVGVLMNTRGLTELLVLQVGYNAGVLTAPLYLALVVMALVTTLLAGPLLQLIDGYDSRARTPASAPGVLEPGEHTP